MRRIHLDLIRAEEELAGARQCIICLCGALLTACGTAIVYKFDVMPTWGMGVASLLLMLFLAVGTLYAFLPTVRENHHSPGRRRRHHQPRSGSPSEPD
jgi:DMSO reductase anchor subunit